MKKLSITKMADTIIAKRKEQKLTQAQLAEMTGINRGMISRLESCDYTPSIDQLQSIAEVLNFEVVDLFEDDKVTSSKPVLDKKYNIAVAGTGYVGLSIATLLSQHNHVTAVDIIPEKVDLINNRKSPIQDDYMAYFGFTNKLLKGETIQIFNYGNCKRDFTYVDDIVEGVKRVMQGAPEKKNGEDGLPIPPYAVYNIGNSNPENLLDFVTILQEELIRAEVLPADYDFGSIFNALYCFTCLLCAIKSIPDISSKL